MIRHNDTDLRTAQAELSSYKGSYITVEQLAQLIAEARYEGRREGLEKAANLHKKTAELYRKAYHEQVNGGRVLEPTEGLNVSAAFHDAAYKTILNLV